MSNTHTHPPHTHPPHAISPHATPPHATPEDANFGHRLYPEAKSRDRSPFQRDRDRILHCQAFRRLQFKTQVFVPFLGDHYRTRLTHTLEVSQIARSMARLFGVNEDLTEAVALAHDLGHPPFGHAGEDALGIAMRPFDKTGFDHNEQSLRIVVRLEGRYGNFDGLNLTKATLEGIAKHNGPLKSLNGKFGLRPWIKEFCTEHAIAAAGHPGLEAQLAAIADDIAYLTHDIEDGVRAGMISIEDIACLPHIRAIWDEIAPIRRDRPERAAPELIRRLIDTMIRDVAAETLRRLEQAADAQAIRGADRKMVDFSENLLASTDTLRELLMERVYRHWKVNRSRRKATRVVRELFAALHETPGCLPEPWREQAQKEESGKKRARIIANYIAGMTDSFALAEYARICDPQTLIWRGA